MDQKTFYLLMLRGLATTLTLTGQAASARALTLLADAYESGRNVDAQLAAVAERLKSGSYTDEEIAELESAIAAQSDQIQGM